WNSIAPGGSGTDKDGNTVTPYTSAENAYKDNQVRMTGSSSYVPGSLLLSLGCITGGLATAVPVPNPTASAPVPSAQQVGGFYRSYGIIPCDGVDFVFRGIRPNIKIVVHRMWVDSIPGLPYQFLTTVNAAAIQQIACTSANADFVVSSAA